MTPKPRNGFIHSTRMDRAERTSGRPAAPGFSYGGARLGGREDVRAALAAAENGPTPGGCVPAEYIRTRKHSDVCQNSPQEPASPSVCVGNSHGGPLLGNMKPRARTPAPSRLDQNQAPLPAATGRPGPAARWGLQKHTRDRQAWVPTQGGPAEVHMAKSPIPQRRPGEALQPGYLLPVPKHHSLYPLSQTPQNNPQKYISISL